MVDSRPPPPKMAIFLPKNGLQMPFLGQKSGFWGRVVSLTPPHHISQMPDAQKHVFKIIGATK